MKIKRFLTDNEYQKMIKLSNCKELQSDNKNRYYHAENMKGQENVKYINSLLNDIIIGFTSFSNFCQKGDDFTKIRIQYNWGAEDNTMYFTGVGYVTIKELKEGFKND